MHNAVWDRDEETRLLYAFDAGETVESLADNHDRTRDAIVSRLVRLGRLIERGSAYHRVVISPEPWVTFKQLKTPRNKS